ncbi:MAG: hypothetical protein EYC70_12505 [Planctomycetota bacterium]|nr:MAG: hypothetical protein EYC70_12505 [Planctomycetota bacterium]
MQRTSVRTLAAAAFLAAAVVVACGDQDPGGEPAPDAGTPVVVELVDQAQLDAVLAAQKGRAALLNFWAMW